MVMWKLSIITLAKLLCTLHSLPLTDAAFVVTEGAATGVKLKIWPELEPFILVTLTL